MKRIRYRKFARYVGKYLKGHKEILVVGQKVVLAIRVFQRKKETPVISKTPAPKNKILVEPFNEKTLLKECLKKIWKTPTTS